MAKYLLFSCTCMALGIPITAYYINRAAPPTAKQMAAISFYSGTAAFITTVLLPEAFPVVVTCAAGYVYLKHLSEIDADIARVDAMIPPQVQPYVNQARATLERLY